jgi:molybdopterin converting factor small subunit
MSEKIKIKIFYYAKIKEIMKKQFDEITIDSGKIKGKHIFDFALIQNTTLADDLNSVFETCMLSLNDEYIDREEEISIKKGDEFSILPPISAG